MKRRLALACGFVVALGVGRPARADDSERMSPVPAPASMPEDGARPAPPSARDAAPLVKAVFERGFPFCKDATFPLTAEEIEWCELEPGTAKKPDPRCPRLVELCAKGPQAQLLGRQRLHTSSSLSFEGPHIPSAVVWILLAVGVAVVVRKLLGQSLALSSPGDRQASDEDGPRDAAAARAIARQVETDVERLLTRARAAAAAGDFERGVADAYAALLRKLEGAGVVRVEAGRTNGDHLREVARKLPAAEADMRPIVRAVERAQFGGVAADEAGFHFVLDGVVRLLRERFTASVPVVAGLSVLLVIVGAGALATLTACSGDREGWDDSPSGQAGVFELLRKYGFEARERLAPLAKLEAPRDTEAGRETVDVMVLMPDVEVAKDEWHKLEAWVARGGALYVAGAVRALPDWIPARAATKGTRLSAPVTVSAHGVPWFTGKSILVPPGLSLEITRAALPPPISQEGGAKGAVADVAKAGGESDDDEGDDDDDDDDVVTADGGVEGDGGTTNEESDVASTPGLWPLLERAGHPYAVEGFHGDGRVVVLADERLFTNAALLVPDDAALLTDLLRRDGRRVEVADDLTGLVSPNPLTSVSRGRLAPALAQLALVVLIFFVYRGAHFGRPRDPVLSRRRAFSEHARALGVQYARGHAARHALWLYGAYALERLRERLHLAGGKSLSSVAEAVAARTGRPLGDVMRVLVEARPDAEPPSVLRPGTMLTSSGQASARADAAVADLTRVREIATLLSQTGGAGERSRVQGQG